MYGGRLMKVNWTHNINTNQIDQVKAEAKTTKSTNSVLYAGNTIMNNGLIEGRREFGRNKAMQIIKDTFKEDKKIDGHIRGHWEKINALKDEAVKLSTNIKEIDRQQKKLMKENNIKPESQEYENLMLLNKERIYKKYGFKDEEIQSFFSEEEWNTLNAIKKEGISDFQKEAMFNQEAREEFNQRLNEIRQGIDSSYKSVDAIQQQRLKTHPMVDAKEAADKIIDITEKSIKNMLINEGLDKIEKDKKENKEKVKEAKESKESKEEKEKVDLEDLTEVGAKKNKLNQNSVQDMVLDIDEVQVAFEKIMDDLQLMEEDLKGLLVDNNL